MTNASTSTASATRGSYYDPAPSPPLPEALREQLGQVSTATLTSVLLKLGLRNTFMTDVRPLVPGTRLVGQAYTLRYIPMREDLDGDALDGRFDNLTNPQRIGIERIAAGRRAGDRRPGGRAGGDDREHPGHAHRPARGGRTGHGRGLPGRRGDRGTGLPAYCRNTHAATNVTLHHPVDVQLPVACGGVAVFPGDALVGDGDGVIVVPRHLAEEAASRALEQERRERFILGKVQGGASILGVYPPNAETLAEFERSKG